MREIADTKQEEHGGDGLQPPRSDLRDAVAWIVFGLVVLVASIRMDRLEQQNINPYTIPGLLPGLLGLAMMLLGGVLAVRSLRRGALSQPDAPAAADQNERSALRRTGITILLCVGYSAVLVGHGLPFWLASAIYVTASILIYQRIANKPAERRLTARSVIKALVIGLASSLITHIVFQEFFLVRLP